MSTHPHPVTAVWSITRVCFVINSYRRTIGCSATPVHGGATLCMPLWYLLPTWSGIH